DAPAENELRGQEMRARRDSLAAAELVEEQPRGDSAYLLHRLVDGRERRIDDRRDGEIVVADDRDVLRQADGWLGPAGRDEERERVVRRHGARSARNGRRGRDGHGGGGREAGGRRTARSRGGASGGR